MKVKMFLCPLCEELTDSLTWTTQTKVHSTINISADGKIEVYDDFQEVAIPDTLVCNECLEEFRGDKDTAEEYIVEVEYDEHHNPKDIKPIGKYWREHPTWLSSIKNKLRRQTKFAGELAVPIYYYIDERGHKVYDTEEMKREFERKLKELEGEEDDD